MLTNIKLYGELGKKYAKSVSLDINSIPELIRALSANFKGFKEDIHKGYYKIVRDNNIVDPEEIFLKFKSKEIKIIPVIEGRKDAGLRIFIGAMLIALSWGASAAITAGIEAGGISAAQASMAGFAISAAQAVGTSLVVSGITEMMFKTPSSKDKQTEITSKLFNGPINTISQGVPVPIGYGRAIVGSATASFSIDNRNGA